MGTKKGIDPLEALETADLLERLKTVQLDKPRDLTPMEELVEELKASHSVKRLVKKRKAVVKHKKMHWKTKRRKQREYYQNVVKYRRLEVRGELLESGAEGWWEYLTTMWRRKKVPVEMTEQEWTETVWPALKGAVPIIRRYQPRKAISLENIYVTASGNERDVLFDGKEWRLKEEGYIL